MAAPLAVNPARPESFKALPMLTFPAFANSEVGGLAGGNQPFLRIRTRPTGPGACWISETRYRHRSKFQAIGKPGKLSDSGRFRLHRRLFRRP